LWGNIRDDAFDRLYNEFISFLGAARFRFRLATTIIERNKANLSVKCSKLGTRDSGIDFFKKKVGSNIARQYLTKAVHQGIRTKDLKVDVNRKVVNKFDKFKPFSRNGSLRALRLHSLHSFPLCYLFT